jgi:hypothetical protein
LICCYNNQNTLDSQLAASLDRQTMACERIWVDNRQKQFSCAAEALNWGCRRAGGDLLIVAHQDLIIEDSEFLRRLVDLYSTLPSPAIAGLAGRNSEGILSNITHGDARKPVGKIRVQTPQAVQTLDELLLVIPKSMFAEGLAFDEKTCDGWHFYGVDLCLTATRLGIQSYVLPLSLHHASRGDLSTAYIRGLWRVTRKHHGNFAKIYTTCAVTGTSGLAATQTVARLFWRYQLSRPAKAFVKQLIRR